MWDEEEDLPARNPEFGTKLGIRRRENTISAPSSRAADRGRGFFTEIEPSRRVETSLRDENHVLHAAQPECALKCRSWHVRQPPFQANKRLRRRQHRTSAPIKGCASRSSGSSRGAAGAKPAEEAFCPFFEACQRQIRDFGRRSRCARCECLRFGRNRRWCARQASSSERNNSCAGGSSGASHEMPVVPVAPPAIPAECRDCQGKKRFLSSNSNPGGRSTSVSMRKEIKARDRPANSLQTRHDRPAAGIS